MDKTPLWLNQWAVIPIILVYLFDLIASIWIVFVKAKHIKLAKKLNISELSLSHYLLKQRQQKLVKTGKIYYKKYFGLVVFTISLIIMMSAFASCLTIYTNPNNVPDIIHFSPNEKEMQPIIITLSVLGAISWESISWPQFAKCMKTRDTSGISLNWAIFLPISCLMSFVYSFTLAFNGEGSRLSTIGGLIFNGIIVNVGILIIKIKNLKLAKQHHMSEIQYTSKYIHKKQKRA